MIFLPIREEILMETIFYTYKLNFRTSNIAENYEA